ncbi:MAG: MOSC domain-containing protein [Gammaproteobacteria bacterium]|nr:MOSC domain-containing protein [Gammaproteobacteria bacterium]
MTITITELFRYPVKSMLGESLAWAHLSATGIPGDRCWTLKDEQRGGFAVGKRFATTMSLSAVLREEPDTANPSPEVHITLPDGAVVSSLDPSANEVLSQAIGAPVSIWPLLPKEQLDHYRRLPPAQDVNQEDALRAVFARTPQESLPDLSGFPEELFTYESPVGTYFDAYPILLLSEASLAAMSMANNNSQFDLRRFRPNILVNTPGEGFVEDQWAGRKARLGDAILQFEIACPRCIMTTHGFDNLPKDPKIMRALVQKNAGNLGMYANVVQNGRVNKGDVLEFLD